MYKLVPRFLLGLSLCFLTLAGTTGCHREPDAALVADNSGPDPADANMAPVDNSQPQPAAAPAPAQGQASGPVTRRSLSRAPNSMLPKPPRKQPFHQTRTRLIRTPRPMTNWTPRVKARPSNTPISHLRHCLSTISPWPLRPITSGLPATGTGPPPATIGFPAHGALLPITAPFGPRVLGLLRGAIRFPPGLLGASYRLLWWHQLWLRLHRCRLSRRLLERQQLLLQSLRQPRQRQRHPRLQPHRRCQQQHARRLQRRQRGNRRAATTG